MSEQENTKIVQQAYSNFKSGDIPSLLGLLSDQIEWKCPDTKNVPFGGKRRGRDAVAEFFSLVSDHTTLLEFEPHEFLAQGNKVAVLGQSRFCIKATGREYGGEWAHVFSVENGRVVKFQEYTDTAAVAAAF